MRVCAIEAFLIKCHSLSRSLTGYINQSTPRAGYYFSFTFTVIGASLLFLSKMYRRAAPPNLFLGRRPTPPSFHRSSDAGVGSSGSGMCGSSGGVGNLKESRDKCSQEPLIYRSTPSASASNGSVAQLQPATLRTVHQDVCTCPHPPPPPPPLQTTTADEARLSKLPKNLGRRIVMKLGLHTIPWKRNPITDFFTGSGPESPVSPPAGGAYLSQQNSHCQLKQSTSNPGYPFDMDWEADYWNGCLGSCNHLAIEGDCDLCHSCADCGLPLDDEDYIDDECQIHSSMHLPDAVDIPELPPEV